MKKIWLATLMAACAVPAVMASNVTVSGAVDTFVAVNRMGSEYSTALSSGGVNASHVGIKGTEDLTPGAQVFFNLDTAIYIDQGSFTGANDGSRLFDREANVGIRGTYGSLSFGRQYTPHFLTFLLYDPTGLSIGSSYSGFFMAGPHSTCGDTGELVRIDNSISYVLPTSFGLTNFFFASLGETKKANGSTSSTRGNMYNYAAKYDAGPFSTMLSYAYSNYAVKDTSTQVMKDDYDVQWLNFSASYDLGFTKPVLQIEKKWGDKEHGSSSFIMGQIGTSTPVAGGLWMISGTYLHNQTRDDADAWSIGTKYNYPISKRTRLFCGIQAIFNEDNAGYAVEAGPDSSLHFNFDGANMIRGTGYATNYLGKNVQTFFAGISHEF